MTLSFSVDDFQSYNYDRDRVETPAFLALLNNSGVSQKPNSLLFVGCGGTISSVFSPALENIAPTSLNPVVDTLESLSTSFGIANSNVTKISLFSKDSRNVTISDVALLLDVINYLPNQRIIINVGTYGLPLFTQIVGKHAVGAGKAICITGAMLISAMKEHDVDFNGGGAISVVNLAHKQLGKSENPNVFAAFHGEIFSPEDCVNLNLHPPEKSGLVVYKGMILGTMPK